MTHKTKYFLIGLTILLCHFVSLGQQRKIDSLQILLDNSKQDTTRLRLYSALCNVCEVSDNLKYALPALELTDKLLSQTKDEKQIKKILTKKASYLDFIGWTYQDQGNHAKGIEYYIKALKIYEELGKRTEAANALGNIGWGYQNTNDYTKALEYHGKALKIDEELGNKKDVVRHLENIGNVYRYQNNSTKALEYGFNALKICQELGDKKHIAIALDNVGWIYQNNQEHIEALEYRFKALEIYEKLADKNKIAETFKNIGMIYNDQGDYQKAMDFHFKALKIYEQLGAKEKITNSLENIGRFYGYQGNYPKALEYRFKVLQAHEALHDTSGIARSLQAIGSIYGTQGDTSKQFEYELKALKMYEDSKNNNFIMISLSSIGNIYRNNNNYTKALDYYLKLLKKAEALGSQGKGFIPSTLIGIGGIYAAQGNFDKALEYHLKALKINTEKGDKSAIANSYENLGGLYANHGENSKALEYQLMALNIYEGLGNNENRSIKNLYSNISHSYMTLKNYNKAEDYLLKEKALSDTVGDKNYLRNLNMRLSQLYTLTGKHQLALKHYQIYIQLRDSISSKENTKKTIQALMNYEFEKKEALAKAEQDKKDAIASEEKRRQKMFLFSVIGGLLLVVLFAGFIFRSLSVTRKQKQIIEIKSKETEQQKLIIEEKNKDITDSINYAKRIQQAKLPKQNEIKSTFPDSFVLFKPKDIVSGDFYYFTANDKGIFIASADCTGHGVPGAFMSMIGSERLDDAVAHSSDTSEILRQLNKGIKTSLRQSDSDESTRDGMDIAICSVDIVNRVVKYAGANRPLWIIRNGQTVVEEIKATKKAIGGLTEDNQHFDTHEVKLHQGDTFYISTDGYADTFGGKEEKKLTTKRFKEVLLSIQDKSMQEQERHLDSFIENWKAGTEQIDDILVIGVRL